MSLSWVCNNIRNSRSESIDGTDHHAPSDRDGCGNWSGASQRRGGATRGWNTVAEQRPSTFCLFGRCLRPSHCARLCNFMQIKSMMECSEFRPIARARVPFMVSHYLRIRDDRLLSDLSQHCVFVVVVMMTRLLICTHHIPVHIYGGIVP